MEDDSVIDIDGINVVNDILNYFYLGLLVMCFILSLGNRPQGSKRSYTLAFCGFAVITIYMTVSTFLSFCLLGVGSTGSDCLSELLGCCHRAVVQIGRAHV